LMVRAGWCIKGLSKAFSVVEIDGSYLGRL
jgi:hypothetical protein